MEPVTVRVGKRGVTRELVDEINCILRKHKKIRVKMLKSSVAEKDRHAIADEIKAKCRARKAALRGRVMLLEE